MKNFLSILTIVFFVVSCSSRESSLEAHALFEKGAYEEAIASYDAYLKQNPPTVSVLYNQGRAYQELKDYKNAESNFERVLDLDPDHTNSILSLANLFYAQKNYNKSSVYAQKAIEKSSNNSEAYFILGRSLHHLGYFNEALDAYNSCITYNKNFGEAYLYRGAIKIAKKATRGACEDFRIAKTLNVEEAEKAIADYCS